MDKTFGYELGDKVVGISITKNSWKDIDIRGIEGTVVDFYHEAPHIGVEFVVNIGGHHCCGHSKYGHGWYLYPDEIKLLSCQSSLKRHVYQLFENKHINENDVFNDDEIFEQLCGLYDNGITLKMMSKVIKEIEKERRADQISDFDVYRL
ncbi:hypothetical protein NV379_02100 [Paenibacillus sp. N1-5-1-14]|uniref:hypothetical protein n=1 Tax=Paenibacillus radicibacter TaxID=2972488 RepID=UPI00215968D3|nr:hypothetical protein [Paenibacillus radicibacter]MCR8641438.1 hypothetical protein [Paenibacillus radicibacter]